MEPHNITWLPEETNISKFVIPGEYPAVHGSCCKEMHFTRLYNQMLGKKFTREFRTIKPQLTHNVNKDHNTDLLTLAQPQCGSNLVPLLWKSMGSLVCCTQVKYDCVSWTNYVNSCYLVSVFILVHSFYIDWFCQNAAKCAVFIANYYWGQVR